MIHRDPPGKRMQRTKINMATSAMLAASAGAVVLLSTALTGSAFTPPSDGPVVIEAAVWKK